MQKIFPKSKRQLISKPTSHAKTPYQAEEPQCKIGTSAFFMKKLITLLLAACLLGFMFTACADKNSGNGNNLDSNVPKSDYNPLNGYKKDSSYPEGQRPVAIMVSNIYAALPLKLLAQLWCRSCLLDWMGCLKPLNVFYR